MAGPTTARRGAKKSSPSGPPSAGKESTAKKTKRGRRWRAPSRRTLIVALVAAALLTAFAVWALYGSSWLRVERVKAEGTKVLTADEIIRTAAVPLNAPLVSVDTEAVAARLTDQFPRIKSVDVVRSWPNTIGLKVTERTPELLIKKGGKFDEVDADGVRFATVGSAPKGVPLLELTAQDSPSLRRFGVQRLQREAVRVASGVPEAVRKDVRTVRVRSYDSITLELTGGRTVQWGSGEQGAVKAKVLTALLKAARDARHFDVSAPTAPAASGS